MWGGGIIAKYWVLLGSKLEECGAYLAHMG